jgi:predicted site-specific integrase-resolvase
MEQNKITEPVPFPTGELVYKREAARFLNISLKTLEAYVRRGQLHQWKNRVNGRVYYDRQELLALLGSRLPQQREVWVYCRASPLPDRGAAGVSAQRRVEAQRDRVLQYCTAAGIRVDRVVLDLGRAGTLKERRGVDDLLEALFRKQLSMVIVETEDRLGRFMGEDFVQSLLAWHRCELHVIEKGLYHEEYREELKEDLSWIILESRRLLGEA